MIRKSSVRPNNSLKNEVKYAILKTIFYATRHLTPREIADETGLTLGIVEYQLSRLHTWGYIWRLDEDRKRRNYYVYGRLKPKGLRIFFKFRKIKDINETLTLDYPLDYNLVIPIEVMNRYLQAKK